MTNHSGYESCVAHREVCGEALTGETDRRAIEPRNNETGMLTGSQTWKATRCLTSIARQALILRGRRTYACREPSGRVYIEKADGKASMRTS